MHYVNLKVNYSWIEIRGLKNFISKEKNCYKHVDVFIICFTSIIACQLFFFFLKIIYILKYLTLNNMKAFNFLECQLLVISFSFAMKSSYQKHC